MITYLETIISSYINKIILQTNNQHTYLSIHEY